jgi:hypothetical protein
MAKKSKKLGKVIEGTVVKIKEVITGTDMEFDFAKLPKEIQAKLGPHGLSQKLGDAAAGTSGAEAVDSIKKVWDGLMAGNWAVRGERGPSVSVSAIEAGIAQLPPAKQQETRELLLRIKALKPSTEADFKFLLAQKIITDADFAAGIAAIKETAAKAATAKK